MRNLKKCFIGAVIFLGLSALAACSTNEATPDNSAISPNGKYIAVVYAVSDGATSGEARVEVSSRRLFVGSDHILNNQKVYATQHVKSEKDSMVKWIDDSHIQFNGKTIKAIK